ncbi:MAG: hypothetical protein KIT56_00655 [Gammaproteobacteria bacterium]|nr:hypothetical protein [Gammaproteobacteria bacterium]MCW5582396.1 hypothetical protein [Gammaproteobacteria bacterium]
MSQSRFFKSQNDDDKHDLIGPKEPSSHTQNQNKNISSNYEKLFTCIYDNISPLPGTLHESCSKEFKNYINNHMKKQ